jgi:hypothetical protein
MNLYTYRRMLENTLSYKDLRDIDKLELGRYVRGANPLFLFDPVRHELSAEPIMSWNIQEDDDNIYRIKEDESIVDCVAYPIKVDMYGFYNVTAYDHGIMEPVKYLEFLNHKDFIGVFYKGNSGITYGPSINTFIDQVPSHLYLKYKQKQTKGE